MNFLYVLFFARLVAKMRNNGTLVVSERGDVVYHLRPDLHPPDLD